jgi:hypothetical protein
MKIRCIQHNPHGITPYISEYTRLITKDAAVRTKPSGIPHFPAISAIGAIAALFLKR